MRKHLIAVFAPALLSACVVGPHYQGPPAAAPKAGAGGAFIRAGAIPLKAGPPVARWWETLDDPALNGLESRALAANPDLAAARARVAQAQQSLRQERTNLLPTASASLLYAHARLPGVDFGSLTNGSNNGSINLYNLGFNGSWEADIFGGERRAIEASQATAEAAVANVADAQVAITAAVAQAYLAIRDRQRRISLNAKVVAMEQQMLDLARQRFAQGTASRLDVERLTQQLENTRAGAVPLSAEVSIYLDQIAVLIGAEPGAVDAELRTPAPVPLPPSELAIGDPAALIQRRPDIRAAERTLAADTAKIGQAEAARFPRVSVMGLIGIGGSKPEDITHVGDLLALAAPQLSWSFLDFGKNASRVHQAEALRDEAEARYRKTVLAALQDAEDSLSRFDAGRRSLASLIRLRTAALETATLSQQRYEAGTTTLLDLLDARRQANQADQNVSQAEAALTGYYIEIHKALGLGWSPASTGPAVAGDQPRTR
ncbi:NodT family efflux transporter outer membrane factor (OMF) lipoprotein [Sphingomonas vulcanisoli]|uniref:NodT family efflux transporter outer membrane factor (OMF) lipoprotein n=1 Tax=Sphingomonas vulcanisoli TaxID=1658060 RepID=A0ABX0TQ88_9SPHN|nr:efflux transporter outer membrane subunit [Sphingomonas vulcanisoli]NIJ07702.1 NodT family efflux transporter outer membrane factor (OMF) lipoprotein [Sphingomonas vulcanisoli]